MVPLGVLAVTQDSDAGAWPVHTFGTRETPKTFAVMGFVGGAAFSGVLFTFLHPGQKVIMPSPYYFNSVMTVRLIGGEVVELPVGPGFQPDYEQMEAAIDKDTRASFIASPNNPTGAVYIRDTIDAIVDFCITVRVLEMMHKIE